MTSHTATQKPTEQTRKHLGMREKLKQFGAKNLTNTELLALILSSGNRAANAQQMAEAILKTIPLHELAKKPLTTLLSVSGLGMAKSTRIIAALELGKRSVKPPAKLTIQNPAAVLPYVASIRSKQREHAVCLYLNARHELTHQETIAVGGLNYSLLEPRDVFTPAFQLPATSIILVHNHPSGTLKASREDVLVTKKLVEAGNLLGITLLDHIIVTRQGYLSLREEGKIP